MKFDVECSKCGCQFISKEVKNRIVDGEFYCSNCGWTSAKELKKIVEKDRLTV